MTTIPNKKWWIISTRPWRYSKECLHIRCVLTFISTGIITNHSLVPRRRRYCPILYGDVHSRGDRVCLNKGPWKRRHGSMPRPFLEWNLVSLQRRWNVANRRFLAISTRYVNNPMFVPLSLCTKWSIDGLKSNCPPRGIRYPPKRSAPPQPTRTAPGTAPGKPTPPGIPFLGMGNLKVSTQGQGRGCVISRGTWFTSGTCATFKGEKLSG